MPALLSFILTLVLCFQTALPLRAQSAGVYAGILPTLIEKIEDRRGTWTAMQAEVTMSFLTENNNAASCIGNLTYHRLEEKMILKCSAPDGTLQFAFKTDDRRFELYIPSREIVFTGDIFDLEDTPGIETYLRALDLYRALKPMMLLREKTEIEEVQARWFSLKVYSEQYQTPRLLRRLFVSPEGDVLKEIYYSHADTSATTIYRSDFRTFQNHQHDYDARIIYPGRITVESEDTERAVLFLFGKINFFSLPSHVNWSVGAPETVQVVPLGDYAAKIN